MRVTVVLGTRPEAIKMAPIIRAIASDPQDFQLKVISTGQHREMLKPILNWFEIKVDVDLDLMQANQSLASLSSVCLNALDKIFKEAKQDVVLVQGDTTTAFIASLAAFYNKTPVAHIEAGLRTFNNLSPWPEEVNRNLISRIAHFNFAPTTLNKENLRKENVKEESIFVIGNTVIDALLYSSEKIDKQQIIPVGLEDFYGKLSGNRVILITGHRRENMGDGFVSICNAIRKLAEIHPDTYFVYPVHLNPNVREVVTRMLSGVSNIKLHDPLGYPEFISLMKRSHIILSDSGGVQEEAPSLGKPVLVMRENTERPEGVHAGTVKLVGTDEHTIIEEVNHLLGNPNWYKKMSSISNPYGNGRAAQRIVEILRSAKLQN